ncbi:hypothetical protein [Pedobacter frigoris]|uniref:Uncharacterized protein n=1 Tax=Pedobacter frigoris TaxID=2571272 RepID=A0A4U1CLY5_9SPHI|nr:hypothetical protein [Pedobacter frigoris]TKC06230.1 hypothetical protein FA047_12985 [Pedobacter frigoris]
MKLKSILLILPLSFCFWVNNAKSQEIIGRDSIQVLKLEKERIKLTSKVNGLKLKIVDEQKAQEKWTQEIQERSEKSLNYAEKAKRNALDMSKDGATSDKEAKQIAKAAADSKKNADNMTKLHSKIEKSKDKVSELSTEIKKLELKLK